MVKDERRLRTIEVAPDGSLWAVTSETDGFGWAHRDFKRPLGACGKPD